MKSSFEYYDGRRIDFEWYNEKSSQFAAFARVYRKLSNRLYTKREAQRFKKLMKAELVKHFPLSPYWHSYDGIKNIIHFGDTYFYIVCPEAAFVFNHTRDSEFYSRYLRAIIDKFIWAERVLSRMVVNHTRPKIWAPPNGCMYKKQLRDVIARGIFLEGNK